MLKKNVTLITDKLVFITHVHLQVDGTYLSFQIIAAKLLGAHNLRKNSRFKNHLRLSFCISLNKPLILGILFEY